MGLMQSVKKAFSFSGASPQAAKVGPLSESGKTGLREYGGYIYEEFLTDLQNQRGRQMLREMSDNDPTIGAALLAITSILLAVDWHVEPNVDTANQEAADFLKTQMSDMEHTWDSFMAEILTMLPFGFSYFEMVFKRRVGPYENSPERHSRYSDGKIGIRKLAPRAQETLLRWEFADNGDTLGFWQLPPQGGQTIYLPVEKCLLFRTTSRKDNPEGRSLLRNAYTSYYYKKKIEIIEAIAIERELTGLPVVRIPSDVIQDEDKTAYNSYIKLARDLRLNEQGSCIIPSDTYQDAAGKPTNVRKVDVELISASGTRTIDTNIIVTRYDQSIARTLLADFLILGSSSRGSFALSKSKVDLFLRSIESVLDSIEDVLNTRLVPLLWRLNGLDPAEMPYFKHGDVSPVDLDELGNYVMRLASAGIILGGDPDTEAKLREVADLPVTVSDPMAVDPMFRPDTSISRGGQDQRNTTL
jgi:hypothetical protein